MRLLNPFAPLLLAKVISHFSISKNRVIGSGRWMEVQWQRFTPRGFKMPQEAMRKNKLADYQRTLTLSFRVLFRYLQ